MGAEAPPPRDPYATLEAPVTFEIERIKNSRFIGEARPVTDEDAAAEVIDAVRASMPDARHHCWAWRLQGPERFKSSDDGEPGGSAGRPILAQITGRELFDVVVVVTVPVSQYWSELRDGQFDMYLLGWSPGTFDAEHPMRFLLASPNEELRLGSWNFGNYQNDRIDELVPLIQQELARDARQAMIDEVHAIMKDEVAYVPLHVQPLVWAVRRGVEVQQRSDNFFLLRWVRLDG